LGSEEKNVQVLFLEASLYQWWSLQRLKDAFSVFLPSVEFHASIAVSAFHFEYFIDLNSIQGSLQQVKCGRKRPLPAPKGLPSQGRI
jgi:hypothetical protein